MEIELRYEKSPEFKRALSDIGITETKGKRIITFHNKPQFELAKKSKIFLEDFFNLYNSSNFNRLRIEISGKKFEVNRFFNEPVLEYLSYYSYPEKKEIIRYLSNISNKYSKAELANKFSLFLVNMKKLSNSFAKDKLHQSIMPTLKALHKNTIPRAPHVKIQEFKCQESYAGFIRAIRSGTLTTAKVMVDGKERRMFFKSGAGTAESSILTKRENKSLGREKVFINEGFVSLAIDPTTLDIYAIRTEKGIHYGKPAVTRKKSQWITPEREQFMRKLVKSELTNYLNETYAKRTKRGRIIEPGIKRMKGIHRRMSTRPKPK